MIFPMSNKLLILGLDGATFRLIKPWVNQGKLPNIGKLMSNGVYGNLQSTIPPITGAAWSTFQTGVNPGKHGIFDWLNRVKGGYQLAPINSNSIKKGKMWDLLSREGKKVGIIGVPVTYPLSKINGFQISGLLTPEGKSYTYPQELANELEENVGKYQPMPEHWRGKLEVKKWFEGIKRTLHMRERTALYLMDNRDWDLLMVHLMETDSIQHQMWHLIDKVDRPRYSPQAPTKNPILEIYQSADEFVGECMDRLSDQDTILLISDHGFGSLFYNVYLNNWLRKEGYLKLKKNPATLLKRTLEKISFTQENLFPWLERFHLLGRGKELKHGQIYRLTSKLFLSARNIDWEKTIAYSYGNIGQIYFNMAGREPQGIIKQEEKDHYTEELIAKLRELKNPYNNEKILNKAFKKEEIYHGGQLEVAPEILVSFKEGYMASGSSEFISDKIISPTFAGSGWHQMEGILIGYGPNLAHQELESEPVVKLIDLPPTILYLAGLPVPTDLDGRVVTEIFRPNFLEENEICYSQGGIDKEKGGNQIDGQEEIKERLKGLGYI